VLWPYFAPAGLKLQRACPGLKFYDHCRPEKKARGKKPARDHSNQAPKGGSKSEAFESSKNSGPRGGG